MSLADFQFIVKSMVPSDVPTDAERDNALQLALARYSQDVPRSLVSDITWASNGYFADMPAEWATGAMITAAEYPVGRVPPSELELSVYLMPGGLQQLVTPDALDAGALVRLTFSLPHQVQDAPIAIDTVPAQHREAVASYAANLLCKQIATHFGSERETSINADGSNTDSRARNFAARARDYRAAYYAGIGKADPQSAAGNNAASATDASSAVASWPGRSRGSLTRMPY